MLGYADFHNDQQEVPVATNVIVYMVTGINEHFSIPVAYYFIKSMDALQKKETLLGVIDQLIDRDVLISNITFDGHSSNKGMCRLLGANLNVFSKSFQPYFVAREKKIYILFDPCHMQKLVRNTLGKLKVIIDGEGGKVMWRYFEQLVRFGRKKEFGLTHKLNQNHLNWQRKIMNVRIAVETLSSSTANSLEFLMKENLKNLQMPNTPYFSRDCLTTYLTFLTRN